MSVNKDIISNQAPLNVLQIVLMDIIIIYKLENVLNVIQVAPNALMLLNFIVLNVKMHLIKFTIWLYLPLNALKYVQKVNLAKPQ